MSDPLQSTSTATQPPLRILLTGASGSLGSYTLGYLLDRGHTVVSTDIVPLRPQLLAKPVDAASTHHIANLSSVTEVDKLFDTSPFDGVIHFAAVPDPSNKDWRLVHNNNVTSSYNVLYTAMARGIKRISQASSINATGLSYTREGKQLVTELPLTDREPFRAEDPYALSKQICEAQADSLCRSDSSLRISSFRFTLCELTYDTAWPRCRFQDLFNWTSYESCAESALLGLTSTGWSGHEVFYICADDIAWEGGVSPESRRTADDKRRMDQVGTLDLVAHSWAGRVGTVREDWWLENPRRATIDMSKAKRLLGWQHRDGPPPKYP